MVLESNTLDVLFVKDGQQGEDGKVLYTWIKYAKDANGTGMTDDPNGAVYIGISYNNESSTESNDPTQYAWTKIQGADGKKGEDAYTIFLENENISFATDKNRNPLSEQAYTSGITIMKGAKPVTDFTIGDMAKTQGIAVAKTDTAIAISVVNGNPLPSDSGEIVIPISVGGTVFKKVLTWTCAKKGDQGEKGEQGIQGPQGEQGIAGKDGTSVTIINKSITYQLSTSGTTIPTGTWQTSPQTIPEGQYQWTKTSVTYSDGNKTESYSISYHGKNGSDGTSVKTTSTSVKYQVGDSGTTKPTGTWQSNVPTVAQGKYLWTQTIVNYSDGNSTESYSVSYRGIDGSNGVNGMNAATVYLYQRATSTPNKPSNTLTYTFSTTKITGTLNNGWSTAIPTGTDAVYVTVASVSSKNDTATIATSAWSAPVVLAQNGKTGSDGKAGLNVATIYLYQRNTSKPSKPSASVTYTFSTGVASGLNNGWSQKIPDGTNPLYVTLATASSNTATDTILSSEWSDVVVMAQNGEDGISPKVSLSKSGNTTTISIIDATGTHTQTVKDGTNGTPGAAGKDGKTSYFHVKYSNDGGKTFTSNSGEDTGIYMGSYTDYTETDSTDVKKYNWVKVKGDKGDTGQKGDNAKNLTITPSSQYFKSTDGGKTFAPNTITIRPTIQGEISFGKWQYSIDGGVSFADVVSGQKGLTISNNVLTVSKDSSLYSDAVTMVTFRAVASDSSFYDTCSIAKIYDVNDIGDGRNLLLNTSSYRESNPLERTGSKTDDYSTYPKIITSIDLSANQKYTLQAKTDSNWATKHDTGGHTPSEKLVGLRLVSDDTNTFLDMSKGYAVFTAPKTTKYKLRVNQYSDGTNSYTIRLWDIKLEKGQSASGWSAAPEDVQTAILSTKSEIYDVSLKVDKNKQAIEQRVEKTTYQQDLNLVKGDINKANEGLNKWRYEIYPKSLFASEYQGKSTMDVFAKNTNLTPSQSVLINDTDFGKSFAYGDNYIGYALTFVKFSAAKSVAITFKHDDGAHLYLNGKLIGGDDTCNTSSGESLTLSFIQGWNCLEVVLNEKSGGEYIGLGTTISALSECQLMNCYYGTPVARQSHITNQLVENTTNIKGISTKVSKVTSVIGDNGENFTSFKNDYSDFKQTMNGFKTTVGQTYVTKDDFNGLEIGGRNLLLYSQTIRAHNNYYGVSYLIDEVETFNGCPVWSVKNQWGMLAWSFKSHVIDRELVKVGDTLTYSLYAKTNNASGKSISCSYRFKGNAQAYWFKGSAFNIGTSWARYSATFTVTKDMLATDTYMNEIGFEETASMSGDDKVYYTCPKLERGTKATDYTPAPEDVNGKIVNVETIANQTAKEFSWIVKGGDSSSNFTLTDRVADLVAERINFNGLVTFSGLNTDAKNEIGKVAQSKVDGLEVGGRNLVKKKQIQGIASAMLNLDNFLKNGTIEFNVKSTNDGFKFDSYDNYEPNSNYVLSYYFTKTNGTITKFGGFHNGKGNIFTRYTVDGIDYGSSGYSTESSTVGAIMNDGNRHRVVVCFTTPSSIKADDVVNFTYIQPGRGNNNPNFGVKIEELKLEKGNKATDWTPAPEDYLPQVDLVSNWTTNTTWIDGGKIYTGSIIADKIAANAITADKIATDAIKSRNYISSGGTQGSFLNMSDGSFTAPNLSWDLNGNLIAKNANLSGEITATKGKIGKYTITDQWLITGSGSTASGFGGNQAFWAGAEDSNSAPFRVGYDGKLTSSNADITGKLTATSGQIGKFIIDGKDSYLKAGSGTTAAGMSGNQAFWAGGDDSNSAPFRVGYNGQLVASGATLENANVTGVITATKGTLRNCTFDNGDDSIGLSIYTFDNTWILRSNAPEGWAYFSPSGICIKSAEQGIIYAGLSEAGVIENGELISTIYAPISHGHWYLIAENYRVGIGSSTARFCTYNAGNNSAANKTLNLGSANALWKRVYAANASISTSDRRLKEDIKTQDSRYEKLFDNLKPVSYKWKGEGHDRVHTGFIAQDVKKAMDIANLSSTDFAAFCYDDFTKDPEWTPAQTDHMTDQYSLAYEEFISLNTHMIQKTRKELEQVKQEKTDLEARLQAIEAKLGL